MILQALSSVKVEDAPDPQIITWGNGKENHQEIPKIIWIFWESKNPSIFVDICISTIKEKLDTFQVNVLNYNNLSDYIKDFPVFKDLPIANISDWIRLYLLKNYGGYWIDASTLITSDFSWINDLKIKNNCEFVGFYSDDCTTNLEYPIVENWFFGAVKNSSFICDWFEEFNKCLFSENCHRYYQSVDKSILQNIWNPEYLLPYISAAVIMHRSNGYRLTLIKSGDMGHLYSYKYVFCKSPIIQNVMLLSKPPFSLPKIIKMTSGGRTAIDSYMEKGLYKFDSIVCTVAKNNVGDKSLRLKRLLNFLNKKLFKQLTNANIKEENL